MTSDDKKECGYYLKERNIKWLAAQGKKTERSASWFLDKLVDEARESK